MKGHATLMSSASDEWATPDEFFAVCDAEFGFTVDAAATAENAKAASFLTIEDDALNTPWGIGEHVWLNPPYSQIAAFMDRAVEMSKRNRIVCLVPARTDTQWWHRATRRATEVRLLKGRLKFGGGVSSAPFPSALVVYSSVVPRFEPWMRNWDWRAEHARKVGAA